jgi:TolB-like protein/DNA-binding winged helix-turn-helix (wHTH) protein/Tfp pilus assembly protein PilF
VLIVNSPRASQVKARFGSFEMDLRGGELRKHGVRIRLQTQPFQILGMLLERPGEVVTREELRQALWPGDTFVDFDHGLNNAINRLREALGDSAEGSRFVETLPRRGYRFIAPVEKVGANLGLPVQDAASLADRSEVFGAGLVSAQIGHTQGAPQREGNGAGKVEGAPGTTAVGRDVLTKPAAVSKLWLWPKVAIAAAVLAVMAAGFSWRARPKPGPYAIAVLPFKNLSSESNSDYFSDGLTDEIIRNLSIIDGLQVKSRTSSFAFKDKPRNIHELGAQLGASLVLEGSVLRSGNNLRINAQLVRVSDDAVLWSQRFDRELKDIFAVQDEISRGIVNNLRLKLGHGQRRYETSVEAYDLYLRARAIDPPFQGVIQQQIDLFGEAVAKDPSFAPAYAGLAATYALNSVLFPVQHTPDELAKTRAAGEKAIQLDPLLAEAHEALAVIFARDGQWEQAEKSFRRAIGLDPNRSSTYLNYGEWFLEMFGRNDEALQQLRVAEKLDPLSPLVHRSLAYALIDVGRYEEAAQYCLKFPADHKTKWMTLARVRLGQGRTAEAIQILVNDQMLIKNPQERGFLGYAYALSGRREEAEKMASAAQYANERALIFAGLGDKERTLEALERMGALGPQRIGEYLNFPQMAFLRGDPRAMALRKKVGLPQ